MIISPIFWKTEFTNYIHPVFANYFNSLNGSLFPVFPWINFILVGAIFSKYFLNAAANNKEQKFIKATTFYRNNYAAFRSFVLFWIVPRLLSLRFFPTRYFLSKDLDMFYSSLHSAGILLTGEKPSIHLLLMRAVNHF